MAAWGCEQMQNKAEKWAELWLPFSFEMGPHASRGAQPVMLRVLIDDGTTSFICSAAALLLWTWRRWMCAPNLRSSFICHGVCALLCQAKTKHTLVHNCRATKHRTVGFTVPENLLVSHTYGDIYLLRSARMGSTCQVSLWDCRAEPLTSGFLGDTYLSLVGTT